MPREKVLQSGKLARVAFGRSTHFYDNLFIVFYAKVWIEENWALYGKIERQRSFLSLSKLY